MSIAFIGIPGNEKRAFAQALDKRTGAVELVIVQKRRPEALFRRLARLTRGVGWRRVPKELWYGLLLRLDRNAAAMLGCFHGYDVPADDAPWPGRVLETHSVNSDEVYAALRELSPDLLVVWGCALLEPRILATAKRAINLHLGHCPHFRGALANQHAVLRGDRSRLGATIHYINGQADAGDILAIVTADHAQPPERFFRELNTAAWHTYLDIASRLHAGERLPARKQDLSAGEMMLLKHWTPQTRYRVAMRTLAWERETAARRRKAPDPLPVLTAMSGVAAGILALDIIADMASYAI